MNEAGGSLALQHLAAGRRIGWLQGAGCLPVSGEGRGQLMGLEGGTGGDTGFLEPGLGRCAEGCVTGAGPALGVGLQSEEP